MNRKIKSENIDKLLIKRYTENNTFKKGVFTLYNDPMELINDTPLLVKRFCLMYDFDLSNVSDTRKAYKYANDYTMFYLLDKLKTIILSGKGFNTKDAYQLAESLIKVYNDSKTVFNDEIVIGTTNEEILMHDYKIRNKELFKVYEKNREENIEYEVPSYIESCKGKQYTYEDVFGAKGMRPWE